VASFLIDEGGVFSGRSEMPSELEPLLTTGQEPRRLLEARAEVVEEAPSDVED